MLKRPKAHLDESLRYPGLAHDDFFEHYDISHGSVDLNRDILYGISVIIALALLLALAQFACPGFVWAHLSSLAVSSP